MKLATLALGVGSGALTAALATADFTGLAIESKPNEFGINVCNVFAEFDEVGDQMFAVAGIGGPQLTISVVDGTFYQHPFGNDRAPQPALFGLFPSLRYDSFVTIGVKSFNPNDPGNPEGEPVDALQFSIGWPGFGPSVLRLTDHFWAVPAGFPQGDPFNPDFSTGGNGQVLIGQFSTADGTAIEGEMEVQYFTGGVGPFGQIVTFEHTIDQACFSVLSEQTVCHVDLMTFTYTVSGIESCTGGSFDFTFSGLGAAVGEQMCFSVVVNTDAGICCTAELCTTVPDCTPSTTLWDMDGDGQVGILDVLALLGVWGPCVEYCLPGDCPGDFDGDCEVQVTDLLLLLGNWG